jgi:BirA family biotin operon repressor/biotin-[acetyl-CoA-carboxylase] ligase
MNDGLPVLSSFYRLNRYDTIGSTNDEMRRLARDGVPPGTLVWALEQTAGRGRRGRPWASPKGNLYLSLLLRPSVPAAQAAQLGFVAALGMGDALRLLIGNMLDLRFKWPNDILANERKIAGILLESETVTNEAVAFVVIGMGVNLAVAPERTEYPATSLAAEGVSEITPEVLLQGFAHHFERWHAIWQRSGFAPIREAWLERAIGLGEPIRVRLERATLFGRFLDLDPEGALLLGDECGQRRIAAGEIFPAA